MRASALFALVLAAGLCWGLASQAVAQEYCVVCAQPQATYRCVIGDARLAGGQPLQAFCLSTLAKEGAHQGCRIKPGTVFDCDGPIKRVATAPSTAGPSDQSQNKSPPATMDRVAKDVVRSSGEQAQKTSESIGGGAKKAWTCLLSFFTSC